MYSIPPTVGRIVHFVLDAYTASQVKTGNMPTVGDHVAALVVRTWGTTPDCAVNLLVFTDGSYPIWVTSVKGDQTAVQQRSWHYPEQVPGL